jgi:putative ATP-dependent endonuclease of the OLD family
VQIRRLIARRYRGFAELTWQPHGGVNCLVGPGDVGKSSILDSIALALHPAPIGPASEHDYHRRQVEERFEIELVVGGLSAEASAAFHPPALKGWDTEKCELLDAPEGSTEPVLHVLARGTQDLEIEHRVVLPNGAEQPLSAGVRQVLGLCLAGGNRPAYREFRLSRGSLLQRTIGSEELRASAVASLRAASADLQLPADAKQEIQRLRQRLDGESLAPGELALALISPPGQNLLGLLGLAVGAPEEAIPLGLHGQGTQRIAAFLLALELTKTEPIITLDEAELGLEPYRQRQLVRKLREVLGDKGQAFMTTHSPTVLAELGAGELHRVYRAADSGAPTITPLGNAVTKLLKADPEALLSRCPIVAEGATECGLLDVLLEDEATKHGLGVPAAGVHVHDGEGQPNAIDTAEALVEAGFSVAAFLDEEQTHTGRRQQLADKGVLLAGFKKPSAEHAIAEALTLEQLDRLLDCPGRDGSSRDDRLQQLTSELGKQERPSFERLTVLAGGEAQVRELIGRVALIKRWFKSREAGRSLARFVQQNGVPRELAAPIAELWSTLAAKGQAELPRHETQADGVVADESR